MRCAPSRASISRWCNTELIDTFRPVIITAHARSSETLYRLQVSRKVAHRYKTPLHTLTNGATRLKDYFAIREVWTGFSAEMGNLKQYDVMLDEVKAADREISFLATEAFTKSLNMSETLAELGDVPKTSTLTISS